MALDPTAREANFRDSIKKYFVYNLETSSNIPFRLFSYSYTKNLSEAPSSFEYSFGEYILQSNVICSSEGSNSVGKLVKGKGRWLSFRVIYRNIRYP